MIDAGAAGVDGVEPGEAESDPLRTFGRIPMLAVLGLLAACADTLLGRVLVPILWNARRRELLTAFFTWSGFARNLAAILGLLVLVELVVGFLRSAEFAPSSRRLAIVTFAGVFMPVAWLAVIYPIPSPLVLLALASGTCLALMTLLAAIFGNVPWAQRTLCAVVAVATTLPFVGLCLSVIPPLEASGESAQRWVRLLGESFFLLYAFLTTLVFLTRRSGARSVAGWIAGGLVATGTVIAFALGPALGAERFANLVYACTGLNLVTASPLAGIAVGLIAGTFVASLPVRATEGWRRVGATGAAYVLLAGYGPTSPSEIILMTVGVLLLTRGVAASAA